MAAARGYDSSPTKQLTKDGSLSSLDSFGSKYSAFSKPISTISLTGVLGPAIVGTDSVKVISEAIIETYDKENIGSLNSNCIRNIMKDLYRSMNYDFEPTQDDIEKFMKVMGHKRHERVTENTLEHLSKKYLSTNKLEIKRPMEKKPDVAVVGTSSGLNRTGVLTPLNLQAVEKSSAASTHSNTASSMTKAVPEFGRVLQPRDMNKTAQVAESLTDRSDKLSMTSDMSAALTQTGKPHSKTEDLRLAFNEFDFDRDGKINSFEFQRSLMRFGWKFGVNPIKLNSDDLFEAADSDDDGQINFEQFSSIIQQLN